METPSSLPWLKTSLRLLSLLNAFALVLQAVLAALFLNGNYQAYAGHSVTALIAPFLALTTGVAASLAATRKIAPLTLPTGFFVLLLLEVVQIKLGLAAMRHFHFPLGVVLLAGGLALAFRVEKIARSSM